MSEDLSAQPYLMFRDPDGDMTRVALENLPLTLGRRSTNEVQVLDPTVSRDHARILCDDAEFVIEDLGSTHGTFVNQKASSVMCSGRTIGFAWVVRQTICSPSAREASSRR